MDPSRSESESSTTSSTIPPSSTLIPGCIGRGTGMPGSCRTDSDAGWWPSGRGRSPWAMGTATGRWWGMLPVSDGGSDDDVMVADGGREVRGGGKRERGGRSVVMLPPELLPPRRGISRDSLKMASRELSLRLSGPAPTSPPRSTSPAGMAESMLVRGGGTGMCGGGSFCSADAGGCMEDGGMGWGRGRCTGWGSAEMSLTSPLSPLPVSPGSFLMGTGLGTRGGGPARRGPKWAVYPKKL